MNGSLPVFVDTNVLVYSRDASEPAKQARAAAWLEELWRSRRGRLSWQVLQEFYVTVTMKLDPGMDPGRARAEVRELAAWEPVSTKQPVVEGAWALQDRFALSFWDALIVSAARVSGCRMLLTEDLQNGQRFEELEVVNPFQRPPEPARG
ncbi:MAG: PIN domain-containing protein [Acidobacteriota bacterium]|nr:PIN domain-containing protein [Acidobacteriota bacterium]